MPRTAIDRIAQPALRDLAVRELDVEHRLEPYHAAGQSEVVKGRDAVAAANIQLHVAESCPGEVTGAMETQRDDAADQDAVGGDVSGVNDVLAPIACQAVDHRCDCAIARRGRQGPAARFVDRPFDAALVLHWAAQHNTARLTKRARPK